MDDDYVFFPGLDSGGNDSYRNSTASIDELKKICDDHPGELVGFNTLGFLKTFIKLPLHTSPWIPETGGIYIKKDCLRLAEIQTKLTLEYGPWYHEYPEQLLSIRHIRPDDVVLEIGANIGRNTLIISSLLNDSENIVSLECDPISVIKLKTNRNANKLKFHIEDSALSKRPLIQKGWHTMVSEEVPEGYFRVNTISYENLMKKYKKPFNTLVADCEGALYYILKDMPEVLDGIQKIILENDFLKIEEKIFVDGVFKERGFQRIDVMKGSWGDCKEFFYEVWAKTPEVQQPSGEQA